MNEIQAAKDLVREYFDEQERSVTAISQFAGDSYRLRAVHPFDELEGADVVSAKLWGPLMHSFKRIQRRQDIFMAAPNRLDDSLWVTSMGKFLGLFDEPWLDLPPTGKIALIPYCEFHRVEGGRIEETALWLDIISVMKQAGLTPLAEQTGAEIVNPGPRTQDGLMFGPQSPAESKATLDLIMRMCSDLVDKDGFQSSNSSLADTWHDTMLWFGPSGIGATYTIERYQLQHQGPFRAGLEDIDFLGHVLEHAEGHYGAWFGWPNMTMRQGDGFLGLPAGARQTEMRVVDVYRREGDRLAENWIFIDLLHYLKQLGVDVLARTTGIGQSR